MRNNISATRKRARQMGDESLKVERQRRLKISHMFTQLQATLPALLPRATKEVIINETIKYIKELETKKKNLEDLKETIKQARCCSSTNNTNCSVSVSASNTAAFFGIQSEARPGLITTIFKVFSNHHAEILAANVSVNQGNLILAITALLQDADANGTLDMIKREIMMSF